MTLSRSCNGWSWASKKLTWQTQNFNDCKKCCKLLKHIWEKQHYSNVVFHFLLFMKNSWKLNNQAHFKNILSRKQGTCIDFNLRIFTSWKNNHNVMISTQTGFSKKKKSNGWDTGQVKRARVAEVQSGSMVDGRLFQLGNAKTSI